MLVVSHVSPMKILLRHTLLQPPQAPRRMYLDVACLCEIDWTPVVRRSSVPSTTRRTSRPAAMASSDWMTGELSSWHGLQASAIYDGSAGTA